MTHFRRHDGWTIVALLLSGFLLRMALLGSKSLWLDEANALHVSSLGQAVLWAGRGEGYHPPFFYKLLEYWRLLGEDEFTLRLFAVMPSTLTIPLFYQFGRKLFRREVATTATALISFSPLLVWYGQELRSYALLGFLGVVVMLSVTYLRARFHLFCWLMLACSLVAAFYLHYFALLLIPLAVMLLVVSLPTKQVTWQGVTSISGALIVAIIAYWPWLQSPAAQNFLKLAQSDRNYLYQLLITRLSFLPYVEQVYLLIIASGLLGILFALVTSYYVVNYFTLNAGFLRLARSRGTQVLLLILYAVTLILIVWPRGYSIKRQLVMFWPFVLLSLAWFWPWQKQQRSVITLALLGSVAACLVSIVLIPKPEWREVNSYILANYQSNDAVLLEPTYMTIPFDYYNRNQTARNGIRFGSAGETLQQLVQEHGRIWHIIHLTDKDAEQRNSSWLDAHMQLINVKQFYRIQIRLYQHLQETNYGFSDYFDEY
jgi:uncharacterized membrane protein